MEKRNIQRTGGSSFSVTLPKQWVDRFKLGDKDPVELSVQPSGALLIQPEKQKRGLLKVTCNIHGLSGHEIDREIIAGYLSGADEIVLQSNQLTQPQRTQIRRQAQSLMGFEIVDESSEHVIIRNIFDTLRFSISQNVEKMFLISKEMFGDAMLALATGDKVLAQDVIGRDEEIDKFHFVILRQFHALMTGKITEEEVGLSILQCYYFSFVASQIERIADHTVKIARTVLISTKLPKKAALKILEQHALKVTDLIEKSKQMVQTLDKKTAHAILDDYEEQERKGCPSVLTAATEPIIADSLDRLQRYILNIAEMTIDQSVMTS